MKMSAVARSLDVEPEKFGKDNKCRALTDQNLILCQIPCWKKYPTEENVNLCCKKNQT